ncbi:MAG: hypothetical protein GC181_02820 [Bacteroidetes bacterium]|nr:hypothetical protein [Bacteroidota bacterium]
MDLFVVTLVVSVAWAIVALVYLLAQIIFKIRFVYPDSVPEKDDVIIRTLADFQYFHNLSSEAKIRFVKRVRFLAMDREFEGKEGLEVTDEMRVWICASIVQITFGFRKYDVAGFQKILIYPDIFYQPQIGKMVKGYASRDGIAFSWKDFQEGYLDHKDNLNLGLHEMAHALHFVAFRKSGKSSEFADQFTDWIAASRADYLVLKSGEDQYLRKYGGTNVHEFFAVCVEHFFETPEEFKIEKPELFQYTSFLLNQDPTRTQQDYHPDENSPAWRKLIKKVGGNPYRVQNDWDDRMIFVGLTCLIPMSMITEEYVLNYLDKLIIVLVLALLGLAILPWMKKIGRYSYALIYALFCLFGIGVTSFTLLLTLNEILPAKEYSEIYPIKEVRYNNHNNSKYLIPEGDKYLRHIHILEYRSPIEPNPEKLEIYFRKGFLRIPKRIGMRVIYGKPKPEDVQTTNY